jgi:hypothetical protein
VTRFNQTYFNRMRGRVKAARDNGIYVTVMLFQGFSIEGKGNVGGDPWQGHPFNPKNNINGVDGGGNKVHTLANCSVTAHQEAYVREVIDTVNDLDNVLCELTNEDTGGSAGTDWQVHLIRFIKDYEAKKPKRHVVGMTAQYPKGQDTTLLRSPAEWISGMVQVRVTLSAVDCRTGSRPSPLQRQKVAPGTARVLAPQTVTLARLDLNHAGSRLRPSFWRRKAAR